MSSSRPLLVAAMAAACSEYDFAKNDEAVGPTDEETGCPPEIPECGTTTDSGETADTSPPNEQDCEVEGASADDVEVLEECQGEGSGGTVTDPWNVTTEWHWSGLSTNTSVHNSLTAPVVGNLTDDDSDGDVDEDDTPDIVTIACASSNFTSGALVVLDGATGSEVWTIASGYNCVGGPALADIDADGITDIVAFDGSNHVVAIDSDGNRMWATTATTTVGYPQATVADVDEDGTPEVIADQLVLDGPTGAVRLNISNYGGYPYRIPAVGDIDLDGEQEIIVGNGVYSPDGTLEWSTSLSGSYGHWSAILNADGDAEAEVAMVASGRLALFEHDGTEIWNVPAGSSQPGPICVADFDGDSKAEIGWASTGTFNLFELDGTIVWSATVDDSSGLAGCSGYDVDGDGAYEVLFADQDRVFIFDGATGAVNFSTADHASGTAWEFPTVADVDNDGSAEIVYVANDYWMPGWNGVTVLGHDGDGWPKSGTTWNVHDFAVTNINSDGSVPQVPDPSWQVWNVYRARPAADDPAWPDLEVALVDLCIADCIDGPAHASLQFSNHGGADVDAGTPWSFYRNDAGTFTYVTGGVLDAIAAGRSLDAIAVDLTLDAFGTDGFKVVVDDDGTGLGIVDECDEANNEDVFLDAICGG